MNFDFKNNLKITYDFQLKYAELMIDYFKNNNVSTKLYEKEDFISEGIQSFFLKIIKKKLMNGLIMFFKTIKDYLLNGESILSLSIKQANLVWY